MLLHLVLHLVPCPCLAFALAPAFAFLASLFNKHFSQGNITLQALVDSISSNAIRRQEILDFIQGLLTENADDPPITVAPSLHLQRYVDAINAGAGGGAVCPFPLPAVLTANSLWAALLQFLQVPGALPPVFNHCLPCAAAQLGDVNARAGMLCFNPFWIAVAGAAAGGGAPASVLPLFRLFVPRARTNFVDQMTQVAIPGAPSVQLY